MKKSLLAVLLLLAVNAVGQNLTRKVLFLGNSYTYVNDLPLMVSQLAASTGDILIYDGNLIGGYTLQDHSANTVSKNKILSNDWDYIVLQEQSQRPSFVYPVAFMNGFSALNSYIKLNKPCSQITSFMTWGYENGDIQNCPDNPAVCTYSGMQDLVSNRYMSMSGLYESEVTPVGVVWKYIRQNHPGIDLYHEDGSHPSVAGSYIAACCFYTSLFRKNPALISDNYGLDGGTALIIRNAVKSLVFDAMPDWYIGKYVPNSGFNYKIAGGTNQIVIDSNAATYRDSLLWNFGDGTTSTANLPTHSYMANGSYTITLTSYKCFLGQNLVSVYQQPVNFCSHNNTIYPNLLLCPNETGTIWTQPADSYQWLDSLGNPIAGATNQSLQVVAGASHSVLTTINGCTERSPEMLVDGYFGGNPDCNLRVIDNDKPIKADVYPNPVYNILNISTQDIISDIAVYDLSGKKITVNQLSANSIDVSELSWGVYVLKITTEDKNNSIVKFVKQ